MDFSVHRPLGQLFRRHHLCAGGPVAGRTCVHGGPFLVSAPYHRSGDAIVHAVAVRGRPEKDQLRKLAEHVQDLPEGALPRMAAVHAGQVKGEALSSRLEEPVITLPPTLDRRLWLLDTIITLAPLLGLLGTIIGMFHAFHVLAAPGHAPTEVTGGVADALVAMASGLFIVILGLLTFNDINNKVRQILLQLDSLKTMLLNRMDGHPMIGAEGSAPINSSTVQAVGRTG